MKITKIAGAFVAGIALGAVVTFAMVQPKTPVKAPESPKQKEVTQATGKKGFSVYIPPADTKSGISTPKENDLVSDPFVVAGNATAFENEFSISVYDVNGDELSRYPAYAHSKDMGVPGPFVELVGFRTPTTTKGKVEIWEADAATGAKIVMDSVNIKFK